jgi:hypothetical protein
MLAAAGAMAMRASASYEGACHVTIPTRVAPPGAGLSPESFNYGGRRLRVHLGWPNGTLPAGALPDGGFYALVQSDGSIRTKVGWWRGVRGRLAVRGRRLDAPALPLRASVPLGYGSAGFQPTGIVFPAPGCWRVTGTVGRARLSFVVKVVKLPPRTRSRL